LGAGLLKRKKDKAFSSKSRSHVIECECGYKILILPDFASMDQAIENHVLEHLEKNNIAEDEADRIRDDLIIQLFNNIGKLKN